MKRDLQWSRKVCMGTWCAAVDDLDAWKSALRPICFAELIRLSIFRALNAFLLPLFNCDMLS